MLHHDLGSPLKRRPHAPANVGQRVLAPYAAPMALPACLILLTRHLRVRVVVRIDDAKERDAFACPCQSLGYLKRQVAAEE